MVLISEGLLDSLHMEESNDISDQHTVSRTVSRTTRSASSANYSFMRSSHQHQHKYDRQLARLTHSTSPRNQSATAATASVALVSLPTNSQTQIDLVNRLNSCQLEDKLYQLKDENLHLKRESQAAEFQLKQLTARLTRLIREKKRMLTKEPARHPREVDLEEIAFEFSEKICSLESENSRLRDRNTLLKVQLAEAERSGTERWSHVKPRVDTGLAKRQPRNFRGNLHKKYASTTAIHKLANGDYSALPPPPPPAPAVVSAQPKSPTKSRPQSGVQHGTVKTNLRRKVSFMSNENISQSVQDFQRNRDSLRDEPTSPTAHSQATTSSTSSSASSKRITSPPTSTSQKPSQTIRKNDPHNIHRSNLADIYGDGQTDLMNVPPNNNNGLTSTSSNNDSHSATCPTPANQQQQLQRNLQIKDEIQNYVDKLRSELDLALEKNSQLERQLLAQAVSQITMAANRTKEKNDEELVQRMRLLAQENEALKTNLALRVNITGSEMVPTTSSANSSTSNDMAAAARPDPMLSERISEAAKRLKEEHALLVERVRDLEADKIQLTGQIAAQNDKISALERLYTRWESGVKEQAQTSHMCTRPDHRNIQKTLHKMIEERNELIGEFENMKSMLLDIEKSFRPSSGANGSGSGRGGSASSSSSSTT